MIYNPCFEKAGHRRGGRADGRQGRGLSDLPPRVVFKLTNIRGALVTMPHKVDDGRARRRSHARPAQIAGACNASC